MKIAALVVVLCLCLAAGTVLGADWQALRTRMVEIQIKARGIKDPAVLAAMQKVPRHVFVPKAQREQAYADHPLPIGKGQTISQPVQWPI